MTKLKPWANGPFEQILHAEIHRLNGDDFDRRIALISFDNSIEVSITTYLTLNPIQRGGREYSKEDVDKWRISYHTKLDFFEAELQRRDIQPKVGKDEIIWYHSIRNDQYHGGTRGVPEERDLSGIRQVALWVFSVLFDVPDTEQIVEDRIAQELQRNAKPERDPKLDRVIDSQHGLIQVVNQEYYTSELLFGVDPVAYREIGTTLHSEDSSEEKEDMEYQS